MSNIRALEPQAFGSIILETTFGDLQLELFTKQCPKITKSFVQLCLDGYYNGTIFDRVEKNFIAIGGKHLNDDRLGRPVDLCPDEFHSRLKFSRRGLLATANTEKDSNGPEFFFTLGAAPELQNKHSIFGTLRGNSVYCLADLNECPVDDDLRPLSEKKILNTLVQENPYPELKPRSRESDGDCSVSEVDEDGQGYLEPNLKIKHSAKKLSYQDDSDNDSSNGDEKEPVARVSGDEPSKKEEDQPDQSDQPSYQSSSTEPDFTARPPAEGQASMTKEKARQKRLSAIKQQLEDLKKQFGSTSNDSRDGGERVEAVESSETFLTKRPRLEDPDALDDEPRANVKSKGRHRERETLNLMENFKKKLKETATLSSDRLRQEGQQSAKPFAPDDVDSSEELELYKALELMDGDSWLCHKFDAKNDGNSRNAKDANQEGDDWYSMDDPKVQRVEAEKDREHKRHRPRRHRDEDDRRRDEDDRHRSRSSREDDKHRDRRHHSRR